MTPVQSHRRPFTATMCLLCTFISSAVAQPAASKTEVTALAVSPDASTIAVASQLIDPYRPYVIYLFSAGDGHLLFTIRGPEKHGEQVTSLAFSPDGNALAVGNYDDNSIRLINPKTGADLPPLADTAPPENRRSAGPNALQFSRDGKYLATCDQNGFRLWDIRSGKLIFDDPAGTARTAAGLHNLAISPNGDILAATDADSYYECNWRKATETAKPGPIKSFAFQPDGTVIAFIRQGSGVAPQINFRNAITSRLVRSLPATSNGHTFDTLAYSPDGKQLILGGGDALGLYSASTGKITTLYSDKATTIDSPQFTTDGKEIIFGIMRPTNHSNYKIGVWDFPSHKLIQTIQLPSPPASWPPRLSVPGPSLPTIAPMPSKANSVWDTCRRWQWLPTATTSSIPTPTARTPFMFATGNLSQANGSSMRLFRNWVRTGRTR